jgi:transposase
MLHQEEEQKMPRKLGVREVTPEEDMTLRRLAASRRAPVRLVQRARLIVLLLDEPGLSAKAAGARVGYTNEASSRKWVKRFNAEGMDGLAERPRSGRPISHTPAVRSKVVSLALQKPRSLGYPFEVWTLERLQRAFAEREGVHLSDSTIWEWIEAEGLRWKRQQSWFHEADKHDPAFVEKRGPSWRRI